MVFYVRMSVEIVKVIDVMGIQVFVYQVVIMGGMEKNVIGNVFLIVKFCFVIQFQDVFIVCLVIVDLIVNCVKEIFMVKIVV